MSLVESPNELRGHKRAIAFKTAGYSSESSHVRSATILSFLLFSFYLFEINIPRGNLNPSNFVLLIAAIWSTFLGVRYRVYLKLSGPAFQPSFYLLIAYIIFCSASAIWSPVPLETAFQGALLLFAAFGSAYFFTVKPEVIVRRVIKASVVFAVLSFLTIVLVPSIAYQPSSSTSGNELRGIFFHQQRLGLFMAISVGLFVIAAANRDLANNRTYALANKHWIWLAILVAALFASAARSYTAFMLASLTTTLLLGRPGKIRFVSAILLAVSVASLFIVRDLVYLLLTESEIDLTLTGRTMVWDRTMSLAWQKPWTGWGFASFTASYFDSVWNLYRPPHAHNSFLQAFFDTGLVGLSLMLTSIGALALVGAAYARHTGRYSYSLFATVMTTLCSATGNFFGGKLTFAYCITILLVIVEAHQVMLARRIQSEGSTTQ